jgi:hypothetical protein
VSASFAFAHTSSRGFVLLLPTSAIILAGAIAVAVSFLSLSFFPSTTFFSGRFPKRVQLFRCAWPTFISLALSCLSFLGLVLLLAIGFFGTSDPLSNLLPLVFWTAWWIVLPLLVFCVGNAWVLINPFLGPQKMIACLAGWNGLMAKPFLGLLLALAILVLFGWWQLVYTTPEDPRILAVILLGYSVLTLLAGRTWLETCDPFYQFFSLLGRLAPFDWRDGLALRLPGLAMVAMPPLHLLKRLIIIFFLGILSFDGLMNSFFWNNLIGVNPLAFEGRSTVRMVNTLGYLACLVILAALVEGGAMLGKRLAGADQGLETAATLSLLPIAIALHFAHYLPDLLVNGQYLIHAVLDPFGVAHAHITTSFLSTSTGTRAIYSLQTLAVLIGHFLAVVIFHNAACGLYLPKRKQFLLELPIALLMVAYTGFSLWSLSTPTI